MAFNRKSILNMQLPTESGWDSTVSIHEKNTTLHVGKDIMVLGHRIKMNGIFLPWEDKNLVLSISPME